MKAKEMLEKVGLNHKEVEGKIVYEEANDSHWWWGITFDKDKKIIEIGETELDLETFRGICKQAEELGWLE